MAEGRLHRALKAAAASAKKDAAGSSTDMRKRLEFSTHEVHIDRDDIYRELLAQTQEIIKRSEQRASDPSISELSQPFRREYGIRTGATREEANQRALAAATETGLSPKLLAGLSKEADKILSSAKALKSKTVTVSVVSPSYVIVRFPVKRGGTRKSNIFNKIKDELVSPTKTRYMRLLNDNGIAINDKQAAMAFQLGHISAVSSILASKKVAGPLKHMYESSNDVVAAIKMEMLAEFAKLGPGEYSKDFRINTVSVKFQSSAINQLDSDYEKQYITEVSRILTNTFQKLDIDWANQKSSPSLMEATLAGLFKDFPKRSGLRYENLPVLQENFKVSRTSLTESIKLPGPSKTAEKFSLGESKATKGVVAKPTVTLRDLLPLINQRLPDAIKSHMGKSGRLKNRTGRFAESAEVVDFGGPFMAYTYQRNPYEVYEADAARDPRPLIEMSIREIAIGLTRERFGLRRV